MMNPSNSNDLACCSEFLQQYAGQVATDLLRTNFDTLAQIVNLIIRTKSTGNRIYIAGNGGSAATASHMANDLVKGARVLGREGFRALCLNDSTPIVTCLANDFAYEDIYSIQLRTYANRGDLFIVFSGSGNSPNVVKGCQTAKEMGLVTIAFGGRDGGKLKGICDYILIAPTASMEQLEDMHMLYEHAIVSLLQKRLPELFDIEVVRFPTPGYKAAIFDFDGTLSLIREGWQSVMTEYFYEVLKDAAAPGETDDEIKACVSSFIEILTGKQTIYQCLRLAEEVTRRGGTPLEALEYKREYHRRLLAQIQHRLDDLASGKLKPDDCLVPGARAFLEKLKAAGVRLFLASGTDQCYVTEEAQLLNIAQYFETISGAIDDYKNFSKAMVISGIIADNNLQGPELIGFGDGYVEIENVKEAGGYACAVATNEQQRCGVDPWKRQRLLSAGADAVVPDFSDAERLWKFIS
ncbi:MAG: SIS domain-containing protein [Planctomycetia bacterium]|nr:SIS domain-containing protein [Planctomycetia bacterium]